MSMLNELVTALGQSPRESYRTESFSAERQGVSTPRRQIRRTGGPHGLALGALVVTLLCVAVAGSAVAGPPSPEALKGLRTSNAGVFRLNHLKLLLVGSLGGGGALMFFGYLYGREWYLNRGFRQYKIGLGANDRILIPIATSDRTSWFKRGKAAQKTSVPPASAPAAKTSDLAASAPARRAAAEPNPAARTSQFGVLNVRADDELHEILVDGKFVGMTPARLTLPEGLHRVELRREGQNYYRREISVIGGAEVSLRPPPSEQGISPQFALS